MGPKKSRRRSSCARWMFSAVSIPSMAVPENRETTPIAESTKKPRDSLKADTIARDCSEVWRRLTFATRGFYICKRRGAALRIIAAKAALMRPYRNSGHEDTTDSGETCLFEWRNSLTEKPKRRNIAPGLLNGRKTSNVGTPPIYNTRQLFKTGRLEDAWKSCRCSPGGGPQGGEAARVLLYVIEAIRSHGHMENLGVR